MASDTPSESVRLDPAAFLQSRRQTAGYRPHLLSADRYRRALDGHPWFTLREADAMRRDPQVTFALRILRAALYQVKVNIVADDKKVGQFVQQQFQKIWRSSLRQFLGFFEYGVSVGEISYATEKKRVVFDRFDPVHPRDARPLEFARGKHRGQFCGIRVRGRMASDCKGGEFDLLAPHAFWFSGESEYGSYWSQPRMAGAYEPWLEKRGRHGAVQSRQLWFKKGAFSGGSIRYPVGRTSYDNGDGITSIDNQDLARQIAEDVMAGAVMSLPSTMDKNGQFLWTYEPPKAGNEVRNILEYPQELDKEILVGMGIPPELVSAATVGSGYSGRAIPAQMFFSSCDEVVHLLVDAIDRQILRNLVVINFGRQCYHILPDSLAEKVLADNDKSKAKPKGNDKQPVQLSLTARKRLARKLRKLEHRLKLAWSSSDKDKHPREKTGRFAKKGSGGGGGKGETSQFAAKSADNQQSSPPSAGAKKKSGSKAGQKTKGNLNRLAGLASPEMRDLKTPSDNPYLTQHFDAGEAHAREIMRGLDMIPLKIHEHLAAGETTFHLVNKLRDRIDPGLANGMDLDIRAGIYDPVRCEAIVANSFINPSTGEEESPAKPADLVCEELFHALDHLYGGDTYLSSADPSFLAAYDTDMAAFDPNHQAALDYYLPKDHPDPVVAEQSLMIARTEVFARLAVTWCMGQPADDIDQLLLDSFPKMAKVVTEWLSANYPKTNNP
ncbi:phage portal protein family protein [Zavarzinella formosa]|uniref:phage portal protein family protein n=1 Tax=Zavarzinella formosa TaxID=360055 RepID=UPI00030EDFED|nr:hypothetical protein [Zavarzinella formosa]